MDPLFIWNQRIPGALLVKYPADNFISLSVGKEFTSTNKLFNKGERLIVVLCELLDETRQVQFSLQDLSGIKLIQEYRLRGIINPVLFTSFLSRRAIVERNPDYEIINTIGHDFLQLPDLLYMDMATMPLPEKLSELELYDIQNAYCQKEGMISELCHRLSNIQYFDINKKLPEDIRASIIMAIRKIAKIYDHNCDAWILKFENEFPEINADNLHSAIGQISIFGNELIRLYYPSKDVDTPDSAKHRRWKLMWVDDEAEADHQLIALFKAKGIDVLLENDSQKAFERIQQDWANSNEIAVVLADYRMHEQKMDVKVQQPVQGYSLLKQIGDAGHIVRLAALSALPRKFLMNSFKHYSVRTEIFSKRDYLANNDTMEILCERIIELGDDNEAAVISEPDYAAGWQNLGEAYKLFRNLPHYDAEERKLTDKAGELCAYYDAHGVFPELFACPKTKFSLKRDKLFARSAVSKLSQYLIARRLAIWLSIRLRNSHNYSLRQVAAFLVNDPGYSENASKQLISQVLGLRLDDYPFGLTIEEKNWLHYRMGINVYKDTEHAQRLISVVTDIFKQKDIISNNDRIKSIEHLMDIWRNYCADSDYHTLEKSAHEIRIALIKLFDQEKRNLLARRLLGYFDREIRELRKSNNRELPQIKENEESAKLELLYKCISGSSIEAYIQSHNADLEDIGELLEALYDEKGEIREFPDFLAVYREKKRKEKEYHLKEKVNHSLAVYQNESTAHKSHKKKRKNRR